MRQFLQTATFSKSTAVWTMAVFFVALFVVHVLYLPFIFAIVSGIVFIFVAWAAYTNIPGVTTQNIVQTVVKETETESIVASISDALMVYDTKFVISLFNPASEKLFGIKKEAIIGRSFSPRDAENPSLQMLVRVLFPTLSPTMIPRSPAGTYPQIVDLTFQDPYLEFRIITSQIVSQRGEITGFVKVVRDRTHEISLLKSKSEFIAITSHQLRTPITNIEWVLQSILSAGLVNEAAKESLENALISANQLKRVVEDLLNISKIEEGRFGYEFAETNPIDFFEDVLKEANTEARRIGISLYFDKPKEPLPPVFIDVKKLGMAIANLIDNAIRYNAENGKVVVRIKKQEENQPYIEASIHDTGIGISQEDIEKIFTKFFRAENATRVKADGSGLGLYIVKNIIQAHGGRVWAESEVNRGSTFYFTLPTDASLVPPREAPLEY